MSTSDPQKLEEMSREYEETLAGILGADAESYRTVSGIALKPIYTPQDIADVDFTGDIGFPGMYPYTRGPFAGGYKARPWNSRQVTGIGTGEETNKRWKYLLSQGATALSVVGSVKSGLGSADWGSESEHTLGHAGRDGVVVDTLADWEDLFDGIDLSRVSVHLITGSPIALACYIAVAQKQGIDASELRGGMSNSVRSNRECLDIIEHCARNMPLFNATYIDVRNIREAGCTAPQEIAFGVSKGMAVADVMAERGIGVDQFAPRISWFVNAGPEFLEEVSKFRAMRRLWAHTMQERYGAKDPRSSLLRCHVQTYAPSLTLQQPLNNIIRSTLYALAAVLGGAQSLSVNAFDEALACPTEFSHALALRTQQIIQHETGLTQVIDPLGGSYSIEWLTNRLEEEAQKIIDEIQKRGGAFEAQAWMDEQVQIEAYKFQKDVDSKKRIVVGVNEFVEEEDQQLNLITSGALPLLQYDPTLRDKQIDKIQNVMRERDEGQVEHARRLLSDAYRNGENVVPAMVEAVKSYITQREIAAVRREALAPEAERRA